MKQKTAPSWIPEDIYSALRTGAAMLLVAMSDNKPVGFTISYFNDIPFTSTKELFIWLAWTIPPAQRTKYDCVQAAVLHNMQTLEKIARQQGAVRITCISPRPGFEQWASQFGFKLYLRTFNKPLS